MRDVEAVNRRMKIDIHNCAGFIQEPKKLKESVRQIFHSYITDDIVSSHNSKKNFFQSCCDKVAVGIFLCKPPFICF